jgi:hypothetical protein
MFLRRRFVTKSFRAGRHSRRLAIVLYVVRHRTMASESHRFGVRFAPNRARWVTYRGPILSGGKTRKKGQGNEWVRRRIGTHRESAERGARGRSGLTSERESGGRTGIHTSPARTRSLAPPGEVAVARRPRPQLWSSASAEPPPLVCRVAS